MTDLDAVDFFRDNDFILAGNLGGVWHDLTFRP